MDAARRMDEARTRRRAGVSDWAADAPRKAPR